MDYFKQESARLNYRKLTTKDIPRWIEFFIDNDRLHFLGIDLEKSKETLAEDWIKTQLKRYVEQGLGFLAVELKSTGDFIGMGGLLPRELDGHKEYEIAYSLIPKFWGNGYATEIARTMKEFGTNNIDTNRLVSIIDINNTDSANVAKKNGMNVLFCTEYLGMQVDVYGSTNLRIRPFNPNDIDSVMYLMQLNTPHFFDKSEQKDFKQYLENELEDYFVVEYENEIVGAGGINYFPKERMARISWDMINPNFQRKGIGQKLTKYRIDHINKNAGIDSIIVRTTQLVYKFYQKMNFELEKIQKDFWADGYDLYQMKQNNKKPNVPIR